MLSRCHAGPTPAKMRFSCDSPLEGKGFELVVPRTNGSFGNSFGEIEVRRLKNRSHSHAEPEVRIHLPPSGESDER